jgi:hypothetical protein
MAIFSGRTLNQGASDSINLVITMPTTATTSQGADPTVTFNLSAQSS